MKSWFTNGLPYHTLPYLEANYARVLGVIGGRTWVWTGHAEEPGTWDGRDDFVEFDGGQTRVSSISWRNAPW